MSIRWSYTNKNFTGNIVTIYCSRYPTSEDPAGSWIIVRKTGDIVNLKDVSDNSFFYYEDKNAYRQAVINAKEVERIYIKKRQEECCIII